jgi:hypothetical protein
MLGVTKTYNYIVVCWWSCFTASEKLRYHNKYVLYLCNSITSHQQPSSLAFTFLSTKSTRSVSTKLKSEPYKASPAVSHQALNPQPTQSSSSISILGHALAFTFLTSPANKAKVITRHSSLSQNHLSTLSCYQPLKHSSLQASHHSSLKPKQKPALNSKLSPASQA